MNQVCACCYFTWTQIDERQPSDVYYVSEVVYLLFKHDNPNIHPYIHCIALFRQKTIDDLIQRWP